MQTLAVWLCEQDHDAASQLDHQVTPAALQRRHPEVGGVDCGGVLSRKAERWQGLNACIQRESKALPVEGPCAAAGPAATSVEADVFGWGAGLQPSKRVLIEARRPASSATFSIGHAPLGA